MRHRADIDGLRAFAVLPVLFNHAGFAWMPGGYLGVDVFFVISGFLITRIILDELAAGTFSTLNFYERRARRILPPLFVMMFACLAAGWFLMSADAYQNLGQSVVATTLFANNVLLTMTSGYWELESSFKPLLHTWSLGVEEQYYFVVPVLLWATYRYIPKRVLLVILLIGAASFAASLVSLDRYPVANFYMLHTRAWELAVGAAAAAWLWQRGGQRQPNSALAIAGMLMIVVPMVLYPDALPSPSVFTVVPVLGTAAVLAWGGSGPADRVLTWQPFVFIGLISYSAYLWHQPLFAFLRVYSMTKPEPWQFGLLIPPALLLAAASWRYIEAPFRDRSRISRRVLVASLGGAGAVLIGLGLAIHLAGGVVSRLPLAPGSPPPGSYKPYNMSVFALKQDVFAAGSTRRLLVLGNSTARDFVNTARSVGQFADYDIVYRDDVDVCRPGTESPAQRELIRSATLIVAVGFGLECDFGKRARLNDVNGKIVVVGPRTFGDNLNPFARMPLDRRAGAHTLIPRETIALSEHDRRTVPPEIYLDVLRYLSADGRTMPVFDESGRLLSEDRAHVTNAGAIYLGKRIFADPVWARVRATAARQLPAQPAAR